MAELSAKDPSSIQQMFGMISGKYDLANTVMSFGIHHLWKRRLISESHLESGNRILDCASGTGDLAFLFEKALQGTGQVTGTDFCEPMLEVARAKAKKQDSKVRFEWADVMNLPYQDHQFDIASISFGIRNVKDPVQALSELGRVVKPGGKVLILEFGQPKALFFAKAYEAYSKLLLPVLGGWVSGEPSAYRYLQTSSSLFPCGSEFLKLAHASGKFSEYRCIPFQLGITYLYVLDR